AVPTDVKAGVSAVALIVAAVLAFWSGSPIRPELSIFVIITAVFMVAAMWVFPEGGVKKGDVQKAKELIPLGASMTLPYRADDSVRPSVLRKVDRVAVGIPDAGFRLAVGRSFLDVGRGPPLLAHRNQGLNALHLETEMIDPLLELIAFDLAFGADRDDRQVDVTVRQIGGGPHSLDNLEAERIGVEFHQSIHVLRENGEMADAGHEAPPVSKSSCRAQPTAHLVTLAA